MLAKKYGWASEAPEHSHRYLVPKVLEILNRHQITQLIDVGTGNGATLPFWLNEGYQVSAMEPDNDGFELAQKHSEADVRTVGVGDPIPVDWGNKFDALVSLEVVEHLFDPRELVETSRGLLKKGGVAIVSTPYHGYWKNLALALFDKWDFHHHPLRVGGHIKFWSRSSLIRLFSDAGFEFVEFHGAGRVAYFWKSMILVFRKPQ